MVANRLYPWLSKQRLDSLVASSRDSFNRPSFLLSFDEPTFRPKSYVETTPQEQQRIKALYEKRILVNTLGVLIDTKV